MCSWTRDTDQLLSNKVSPTHKDKQKKENHHVDHCTKSDKSIYSQSKPRPLRSDWIRRVELALSKTLTMIGRPHYSARIIYSYEIITTVTALAQWWTNISFVPDRAWILQVSIRFMSVPVSFLFSLNNFVQKDSPWELAVSRFERNLSDSLHTFCAESVLLTNKASVGVHHTRTSDHYYYSLVSIWVKRVTWQRSLCNDLARTHGISYCHFTLSIERWVVRNVPIPTLWICESQVCAMIISPTCYQLQSQDWI